MNSQARVGGGQRRVRTPSDSEADQTVRLSCDPVATTTPRELLAREPRSAPGSDTLSPAKAGSMKSIGQTPRVTLASLAHPGLRNVAAMRLVELKPTSAGAHPFPALGTAEYALAGNSSSCSSQIRVVQARLNPDRSILSPALSLLC
jgi:hypothetical protein